MPSVVRTRPDIITKSALIVWLSHQVKRRERQKEVPVAFINYFNHLVRRFKEDDFIEDGEGWFDEIYNLVFCAVVDNNGATQLCNEDVTAAIAATVSRAINNQGRVSAADFVTQLASLSELNWLEIDQSDKTTQISSKRQFLEHWGFKIDVALSRC
ncbi:hypothetical protein [Mesorhizobium sp. B2-6-2]|uniref:hypothetical protein n=1 Tax=Mesorhizobium sp. B2-6-2 TaxID=2589915 RepID=UPI001126F5E2|nr:hypothetical protein [Mesorhizobium sp. B2-6-2]TPJ77140.1 hypothetical protein FJ419_16570 [Mesorhizobium sp. B2-6-2]